MVDESDRFGLVLTVSGTVPNELFQHLVYHLVYDAELIYLDIIVYGIKL